MRRPGRRRTTQATVSEEAADEDGQIRVEIIAGREIAKDFISDFETLAQEYEIVYIADDFEGGEFLNFQIKEDAISSFTALLGGLFFRTAV